MPSSLVRRPGPLYLTVIGLIEEYYTLLNQKYVYYPFAINPTAPPFEIPEHHRYDIFLKNYAHLNVAQISHQGSVTGFADFRYILDLDSTTSANPTFEARVRLIDEVMDTWARDEGIIRLTTQLAELLSNGRTLCDENRRRGGNASYRTGLSQFLFQTHQISLSVNEIISIVQNYVKTLRTENAGLESIDAMRQVRGLPIPGAHASAGSDSVLPIALPEKIRRNCCNCLAHKPGYIICSEPENHFICQDCLPGMIRYRSFRGKGSQRYKCIRCEKTPNAGFIELLNQPEYTRFIRLYPGERDWLPDEAVSECTKCKAPFSFFFRRHHCRRCGLIICYYCSEGSGKHRFCKGTC